MAAATSPSAPERLVEMSPDVRAAVLLDPAGGLIASSEKDDARARELGELARELTLAVDSASAEPTEQVEVGVTTGCVYAVRTASHTLACVTRRLALPSLILYDLRQTLLELERTG